MTIIKEKLKLFHFALTMTLLPRKLVRQIFWFPKYTLYLHQELICYRSQNRLSFRKGKLYNFDFILINNGKLL